MHTLYLANPPVIVLGLCYNLGEIPCSLQLLNKGTSTSMLLQNYRGFFFLRPFTDNSKYPLSEPLPSLFDSEGR